MARTTRAKAPMDADNSDNAQDDPAELKRQLAELQSQLSSKDSQLQQERGARIKAEEATMSQAERAIRAELSGCEGNISSMTSEADSIEAQIARLSDEPGHGVEIAKLTRRLASVEADVNTETQRKNFLNQQIERAKTEVTNRAKAAPQGEVLATGVPLSELSPRVQAWFKAHPKSFTDAGFVQKAIAAANYAVNVKGIPVESDDYFAFVDEEIGERARETRQDDEGVDLVPERPNASAPYSKTKEQTGELDYRVENPQAPAAGRGSAAVPVSRSTPTNSAPTNRRQPMLTSEQREVADSLYSHIKNPADRYQKYFENDKYMKERQARSQMNN